jgi:hypothetical protein
MVTFTHASLPVCFCAITRLQYPCASLHFTCKTALKPASLLLCLPASLSVYRSAHPHDCLYVNLPARLFFSSISVVCLHFVSIQVFMYSSLSICLLQNNSCVLSSSVCLLAFCMSASFYLFCMHFCTIVCLQVNFSLCMTLFFPGQ